MQEDIKYMLNMLNENKKPWIYSEFTKECWKVFIRIPFLSCLSMFSQFNLKKFLLAFLYNYI